MPVYKSRIVLEIARGVKAFFNVEAGITRGIVPDQDPARLSGDVKRQLAIKDQQIAELRAKLSREGAGGRTRYIRPENITWIFGTARVGSTWLGAMMEDLEDHSVWHEPIVGRLFGDFYYAGAAGRRGKHFIMGDRYKGIWIESIRSFVLDGATARFPEVVNGGHLIVKEPNGSIGAPLMMAALPESRMIFLVRDPRDVAASGLDAARKGSWLSERRGEKLQRRTTRTEENPDSVVRGIARRYVEYIGNSKLAYEAHNGLKVLVKYENLVSDTLGEMKRIHSVLDIPVDGTELAEIVKKHSWENIPQDKKGEGKFYRKGTPGSWREDLTPEQIEAVQRITAPLLAEFYPDNATSIGRSSQD